MDLGSYDIDRSDRIYEMNKNHRSLSCTQVYQTRFKHPTNLNPRKRHAFPLSIAGPLVVSSCVF